MVLRKTLSMIVDDLKPEPKTENDKHLSKAARQEIEMSKETSKGAPRRGADWGSCKQTEEPWKGPPEKDQFDPKDKPDLEKWKDTKTH